MEPIAIVLVGSVPSKISEQQTVHAQVSRPITMDGISTLVELYDFLKKGKNCKSEKNEPSGSVKHYHVHVWQISIFIPQTISYMYFYIPIY